MNKKRIWHSIYPYLFSFITYCVIYLGYQLYGYSLHLKVYGGIESYQQSGILYGVFISYLVGVACLVIDKNRTVLNKIINSILMLITASVFNVYTFLYLAFGVIGYSIKYLSKIFGAS